MTKLFYCAGYIHTLKIGASGRQLFRRGRDVMIERGGVSRVLCADRQASSLGLLVSGRFHSIACTVYGGGGGSASLSGTVGFSGYYLDPATQHYILGNGYRAYSRDLMRFLSSDGLSPFAQGGINAYAYCGGNPVDRVDPDGQSWTSALTFKQSLSVKLKGAQVSKAKIVAVVGADGWRAKRPVAKLSHAFKSEFDSLPSTVLGQVDFQEIRPLVSYRSLRNAKHELIRAVRKGRVPRDKGVLPADFKQLKGFYNLFNSSSALIPAFGRRPNAAAPSARDISAAESLVRGHFEGILKQYDGLIKAVGQTRDETAVALGSFGLQVRLV